MERLNETINLRENIILECSQSKSNNSNQVHTWENEINELNILEGDEIQVYQSFINIKGASNETIQLIDQTINGENPCKTPIEIEYYKCNDGLNCKNMPYATQLLSMGTDENNINMLNTRLTGYGTNHFSQSIKGSGMYVGTNCIRNIKNENMLVSDLCNAVDCSRYTLMELERDTTKYPPPYVRHKIVKGTHTFNINQGYYTPQNICDSLTKSLNNPTITRTQDEFGGYKGLEITSPVFITQNCLYRKRLGNTLYGGTAIWNALEEYNVGKYLPKSVWGWDLTSTTSNRASESNEVYAWYKWGNNDGTALDNLYPNVSEKWFNPSPSWDFYGGTDMDEITTYNADEHLKTHTNYYFRHPESLIIGESIWNEEITEFIGSSSIGSTGTIITGFYYNNDTLDKFENYFNMLMKEGAYDNLYTRNYVGDATGSTSIKLDTTNQRCLSVARLNDITADFGDATFNNYYGFKTNKYGYDYGCDMVGFGNQEAFYSGSKVSKWFSHSGTYTHSIQHTLGSYVSANQFIKYDKTDNNLARGFAVNYQGALGFVVENTEGGFQVLNSLNSKIGWFPKFTDFCNSAICYIQPDGLGSPNSDLYIDGTTTGTNNDNITTLIQEKLLYSITAESFYNTAGVELRTGTDIKNPKSHSTSAISNVVGAIYPQFKFDTDLSRFEITDLHTPEYNGNSVYVNQTPSGDGSSVIYFNPVFQQEKNEYIGAWGKESGGAIGSHYEYLIYKYNTPDVPIYIHNSDRNRNTINDDVVKIFDSNMGIFISKWSATGLEENWSNTLFSKLGWDFNMLNDSTNGRNFRNEDNVLGSKGFTSYPITTNANLDTKLMNQLSRNKFDIPKYDINGCGDVLQRIITGSSTSIVASKLPIKNDLPYYIIESSILSYGGIDEYRQSKNVLPAIDICSLNYNSEDYYFAEPSQLIHTASKDLNISSIKTTIRRPDGTLANELSGNSSIIYKVSRNKSLQPFSYQEDIGEALELMDNSTRKLGVRGKTISNGISLDTINRFSGIIPSGVAGKKIQKRMKDIDGMESQLKDIGEQEQKDLEKFMNKLRQVNRQFDIEKGEPIKQRELDLELDKLMSESNEVDMMKPEMNDRDYTNNPYQLQLDTINKLNNQELIIQQLQQDINNNLMDDTYGFNIGWDDDGDMINLNTGKKLTQKEIDNINDAMGMNTGELSPSQISLPDDDDDWDDDERNEPITPQKTQLKSQIRIPTEDERQEEDERKRLDKSLTPPPKTNEPTEDEKRKQIYGGKKLDEQLDDFMKPQTQQPTPRPLQPTKSIASSNPMTTPSIPDERYNPED